MTASKFLRPKKKNTTVKDIVPLSSVTNSYIVTNGFAFNV